MSCPYCGSEEYISLIASQNVSTYHNPVLVATTCCKKPIRLSASISFTGSKINTAKKEDDWGTPFSKPSLVGKFILVRYDVDMTTGVVYKIKEDDPAKDWILTEQGVKFNRSSILLIGTEEEITSASVWHKNLIISQNQKRTEEKQQILIWFNSHNSLQYKGTK